MREAERQRRREQRMLMRQQRGLAKFNQALHGAHVVAEYEAFVHQIVTVHTRGSQAWNWQAIAQEHAPQQPQYVARHEQQAQHSLATFRPDVTDRLLGKTEQRRAELAHLVEQARHHDHAAYQQAIQDYQRRYQEWQWRTDLAQGILSGDLEAFRAALEFLFPIGNIPELSALNLESNATWYVEATMQLQSDDDLVPSDFPSQLKSGALSWKSMPKTKYNELYQDHVCSCVLRIAWELFALLPISMAFVHVLSELLNTATGHMESTPILSVAVARDTMLKLNAHHLDPSDAMENFVHKMKFTGRSGFQPVDKLDPTIFNAFT